MADVVTLRIFVGRAGAARLMAGELRYVEAYRRDTTLEVLSSSIDALASSMHALEAQCLRQGERQGRIVAVAEHGNVCQVLGRTGGLPLQPGGHSNGMA